MIELLISVVIGCCLYKLYDIRFREVTEDYSEVVAEKLCESIMGVFGAELCEEKCHKRHNEIRQLGNEFAKYCCEVSGPILVISTAQQRRLVVEQAADKFQLRSKIFQRGA